MFLNSHQLYNIISSYLYSFKVKICKISITTHSSKFLSHSNMRLIDSNTLFWNINWMLMGPFKFFRWIPKYTIVKISLWVLNLVSGICRVSIHFLSIRSFDVYFIFWIMRNSWSSILICLNGDSESTKFILSASKLFSIPSIEISKYSKSFSLRSPFFICKISIWLQV